MHAALFQSLLRRFPLFCVLPIDIPAGPGVLEAVEKIDMHNRYVARLFHTTRNGEKHIIKLCEYRVIVILTFS